MHHLPLFDGNGNRVLDAQTDVQILLTEDEARVLVRKGMATVRHSYKKGAETARYIMLRVSTEKARESRLEKLQRKLSERNRLPNTQPYCVAQFIYTKKGECHRVYQHVAHRCSAAQPYMAPVSADWM